MRRFSRPALIAASIATGFSNDRASLSRAARIARDFDRDPASLVNANEAINKAENKRERRRQKRLTEQSKK